MKVLLLTPDYHCGVVESAGKWPPLTLVYLAGEIRKAGYVPVLFDAMTKNVRMQTIRDKIASELPQVVAITAYTATFPAAMEALMAAKEVNPAIITVLGGIHGTFCFEEVLREYPSVDYVVLGEGELTFTALLDCINSGGNLAEINGIAYRKAGGLTVVTPSRPLMTVEELGNLDPAFDLMEWSDYVYHIFPGSRLGAISTSRGCMHECTFCSQQKFWNKNWRGATPDAVGRQITRLVNDYAIDTLLLADEHPTHDRERFEAILDWLIAQPFKLKLLLTTRVDDIVRDRDIIDKYKKAGVVHVYVGIEATDQDKLDAMRKKTIASDSKQAIDIIVGAGMITETSFVLGSPDETEDSITATLALAKEYNPDFAHFLFLTPWPYADLYPEVKHLIEEWDYSKYNLIEPIIVPPSFAKDELFKQILRCYQDFYMFKLKQWARERDSFRKQYMVRSLQVMLGNSFLTSHVPVFGKMPTLVKQMLTDLGVPADFFLRVQNKKQ